MHKLCHIEPTISACFTLTSLLFIITTLIINVIKYPFTGTNSNYIKRGAALTRLWYRKHTKYKHPLKRIYAFLAYKIHLYITYMFVKYAYRYLDDSLIIRRLKKII